MNTSDLLSIKLDSLRDSRGLARAGSHMLKAALLYICVAHDAGRAVTTKELSRWMGLSHVHVGHMVSSLTARGFLVRRKTRVRTTRLGWRSAFLYSPDLDRIAEFVRSLPDQTVRFCPAEDRLGIALPGTPKLALDARDAVCEKLRLNPRIIFCRPFGRNLTPKYRSERAMVARGQVEAGCTHAEVVMSWGTDGRCSSIVNSGLKRSVPK